METPPAPSHCAAREAALQLAAVLGLTCVLAAVAIPDLYEPTRLVSIPVAALVLVGLIAVLPWQRWPLSQTTWLGLPCFAVLGAATWIFDGFAAGTGPFFILVFGWAGLHHGMSVIGAYVVPATVAYAGGLWEAEAPAHLLGSTVVLIPIAVTVGLVISRHVGELRKAHDVGRADERWRAAMMSTLAHDVRTPLTSINGALEIVVDDSETPRRLRPLLESAIRQARRITRLAGGLLDLERVEQGKLRLEHAEVAFASFATEVVAITSPTDVTVDADLDTVVWADPERLEQILVNLTTNALRHGRPPVVLAAHQDGDRFQISVRDHGSGVPEDDVAELFGRFSSADRSPQSVGLGLWIVRLLAQAHGGEATYEPADPGGSVRCQPAETVVRRPTATAGCSASALMARPALGFETLRRLAALCGRSPELAPGTWNLRAHRALSLPVSQIAVSAGGAVGVHEQLLDPCVDVVLLGALGHRRE
jgi:signal transduction histidine kinase